MERKDNNVKGAYIRETREMAEKAAKQNPESIFIGLDDYLPFLFSDNQLYLAPDCLTVHCKDRAHS